MTKKEVERAKTLGDVLAYFPTLRKNARRKKDGREGLSFQVHLPGSNYVGSIEVDPKTAKIVLAAAEKIVRIELKKLGVK